ncbi:DNA-binding transcriptional repressor DeoR [Citrobacter freundii]|nr:DNA-binding transcriptional repressor DeoR [Citrobacter freundii]
MLPSYCSGGYIVLEPRSANHYLISDQKSRLVDEKRRAAQLAASLVQAHQTIFFDCGTTTPWIIEAIDNELPFTAICYSLNTFLVLQEKTAVPRHSGVVANSMPVTRFLNRSTSRKR